MTWHPALTTVRNTLATLYPTREDAVLVVDDAGLDALHIQFSDKAITNWHNILTEAVRREKVTAVLAVAREQYPENNALLQAVEAYTQQNAAAQPGARGPSAPGAQQAAPEDVALWRTQLQNLRENLRLIEERTSEYVLASDVPLQLVREQRRIEQAIAELEQKLQASA